MLFLISFQMALNEIKYNASKLMAMLHYPLPDSGFDWSVGEQAFS